MTTPKKPAPRAPGRLTPEEMAANSREAAQARAASPDSAPEPPPNQTPTANDPVDDFVVSANSDLAVAASPHLQQLATGTPAFLRRDGGTYERGELAALLDADPEDLDTALSYALLHNEVMRTPDGRFTAYAAVERGGRPR